MPARLPRRMVIAALMSLLVHGLAWWALERGWAQRLHDKHGGAQRQGVPGDLQVRLILPAPKEVTPAAPSPAPARVDAVPVIATVPVKGPKAAQATRQTPTIGQHRSPPAQTQASGPAQDPPQQGARGPAPAGPAHASPAPAASPSMPAAPPAAAAPGPSEEPLQARLGAFARQHGTRLERDAATAPLSPAARGNSMGVAMDKALKLAGSGWREYRGQHGESVVRFSAGTCTRIKPLPDHEQRHLNKTVEVVGCPD